MAHVKINKKADGWHVANASMHYEETFDSYAYAVEVAQSLVQTVATHTWSWK